MSDDLVLDHCFFAPQDAFKAHHVGEDPTALDNALGRFVARLPALRALSGAEVDDYLADLISEAGPPESLLIVSPEIGKVKR